MHLVRDELYIIIWCVRLRVRARVFMVRVWVSIVRARVSMHLLVCEASGRVVLHDESAVEEQLSRVADRLLAKARAWLRARVRVRAGVRVRARVRVRCGCG